ncbi:hypothetical protein BDFB_009456 [Asbolus verrucosus]|uniref:Tf2-1-like SH3-like domain-containing protein n=1 Tax=Asbolus verrucosus TaxID=1661398 RepID=A0A482W017_ASBVE|nr:hypothetical protein BDFB_009456 [Asbolus verrucosus]
MSNGILYRYSPEADNADQRRRSGPEFDPGDKVWVATHVKSNTDHKTTSKFVPKRDGPYIVKRRISETSYEIAELKPPHRCLGKYHVSALTPYIGPENVPEPVVPIRRRGRPPKRTNP